MPLKISCTKCKNVLYQGDFKQLENLVSNDLKGTCSSCGHSLNLDKAQWFLDGVLVEPSQLEKTTPKLKTQEKWWKQNGKIGGE